MFDVKYLVVWLQGFDTASYQALGIFFECVRPLSVYLP